VEKKRGEIPRLRKPTPSRERRRKKKRRLAPLRMTILSSLELLRSCLRQAGGTTVSGWSGLIVWKC
jgi:hypothetical protein